MKRLLRIAAALAAAMGVAAAEAPKIYGYEIVATYPHDPEAFTQGLFFHEGALYEGTGQYGASSLRKVELETGKVLQARALPDDVFGEGIALSGDEIVALTWRNGSGFVFDSETFEEERRFAYEGEGWGLTSDGARLIMSDGTATLRFLDPQSLSVVETVTATYNGRPLSNLNELEWIDGSVFANIWRSDIIARIDPATGVTTGLVDMRGLKRKLGESPSADVLNGIAYDPETQRLFVTGKNWPKLFEIRLVERAAAP